MLSIIVLTHNRLESLKKCIGYLRQYATVPYEIIIVDNASTDGTSDWVNNSSFAEVKLITNKENRGIIAKNQGFKIARYPFLASIDDDVYVGSKWDQKMLDYFNSDDIGAVCQQGGIIRTWMNFEVFQHNNTYVDFMTGFCFIFRNVGIIFDEQFGKFWHEDAALSLSFKAAGYKIRMIQEQVCIHASQRTGEIDWTLHNKNLDYIKNKWKDNLDVLRLGGN